MKQRGQDGFTLIELMMVGTIAIILMAIAIPSLRMTDRVRVDNAARAIQQELQAARLRAVGVNRRLEVRFNCPSAGQYRIVESGTTWPSDASRCNPSAFPYPPPPDAAYSVPVKPRYDGPPRRLSDRVTLTASSVSVQFGPDGRATKAMGGTLQPVATETFTVAIGPFTSTVEVNGMGKALIR